jgi:hypothetical protein
MIANVARKRSVLLLIAAALGAVALMWGCSNNEQNPVAPSSEITLDASNPQIQAAMAVQNRYTAELMSIQDVIGTATTLDDNGNPAILVLVTTPAASSATKMSFAQIEGYPVVVMETDPIVAMKGGGGGVSHTAIQTPPIQLGTSGGWRHDLANGFCCGGTLGSLVQVGSTKYVLSNYHVFRADIVSGGNGIVATNGDPIIQPGLIDVNCNANSAQNVATLAGSASLPGSNVDCAIAQVITGMVSSTGSILEVGNISVNTVAASVNQAVKKSGRTTGLTRSTVSGLNANVSVSYENECAGGTAFTKSYTGQILVKNNGSRFLAGGDSGSLMVEDLSTNPRAVGLLFAGSSSIAVANPIGQVLSFLGATMVGN